MAGGYDPRLAENVCHLTELKAEAAALGLGRHVSFVPSFSAAQHRALLAACCVVLYTPQVQT
jgi:alpha-1,3/alpha-1,6-mannosyltransferase